MVEDRETMGAPSLPVSTPILRVCMKISCYKPSGFPGSKTVQVIFLQTLSSQTAALVYKKSDFPEQPGFLKISNCV